MKRLTLEEFINKANKIHNNKYDYKQVKYINNCTKVKIICQEHGIFEQRPNQHMEQKQGCPKCSGFGKSKDEIIKDFNKIHGKYKYDLSNYKNKHSIITIICPKHGEFKQIAYSHQNGIGCPACSGMKVPTTKEFIIKSNLLHKNKYDYSLTVYKSAHQKVKIICPEHGIFEQTPNSHIRGKGCAKCKNYISKPEREIMDWLKQNKIKYIAQHKFPTCKYKKELPFDFYLPDSNLCIEYDGLQHFKIGWNNPEKLKFTQLRDKIKTDFCKNIGIELIRIRYNEKIIPKIEFLKNRKII